MMTVGRVLLGLRDDSEDDAGRDAEGARRRDDPGSDARGARRLAMRGVSRRRSGPFGRRLGAWARGTLARELSLQCGEALLDRAAVRQGRLRLEVDRVSIDRTLEIAHAFARASQVVLKHGLRLATVGLSQKVGGLGETAL